jgi:hypothetical protein
MLICKFLDFGFKNTEVEERYVIEIKNLFHPYQSSACYIKNIQLINKIYP